MTRIITVRGRSTWMRGIRGQWLFVASSVFLGIFVLMAIFAPLLAPYDPNALDLSDPFGGISAAHLLGTDGSGRDTLSRLMYGAELSLLGPLVVVVVTTIAGIVLGVAAGWVGGKLDWLLTRIFDILFSFPALLLAILSVALFGKGLVAPVIAMCIAYVPYVALLVRSLMQAEKSRPYVAAYRVQGFSAWFISFGRVLPNVAPVVLAQSTLNFGYVLMDLAGLSFLGLGVQAPQADWGSMINDSSSAVLAGSPLTAIVPAVAVVLAIISVNVIGEHFADRIAGRGI